MELVALVEGAIVMTVWVCESWGYDHGELHRVCASEQGALAWLREEADKSKRAEARMRDHIRNDPIARQYQTPEEIEESAREWRVRWHGRRCFSTSAGMDKYGIREIEVSP